MKANIEMLSFNENNSYFPHDPFDKGIVCTHVRICSLHISKKCFRLKCFYYQTFAFNMFSNIYLNISRKIKQTLFFFGSLIAVLTLQKVLLVYNQQCEHKLISA